MRDGINNYARSTFETQLTENEKYVKEHHDKLPEEIDFQEIADKKYAEMVDYRESKEVIKNLVHPLNKKINEENSKK